MTKEVHAAETVVVVQNFKALVKFQNGESRWVDLSKWLNAVTKSNRFSDMQKVKIENGDLVFRDKRITGPTLYHMGMPSVKNNLHDSNP